MKRTRNKPKGKWRQLAVLLTISGMAVLLVIASLYAEPQDSAKSKLQEGIFVKADTTHRPPNQVSLKALERLQANSAEKWNVQWNEFTGLPKTMKGITKHAFRNEQGLDIKDLMKEYGCILLGISDTEIVANYSFSIVRETPIKGGKSIQLQGYFKGVKIWEGLATILVTEAGNVTRVQNYLWPIRLENLTPTLQKSAVEELISQTASPEFVENEGGEMELCIYASSPPRLAYAGFKKIGIWTWVVVVDANTGEFIRLDQLGHEDGPPQPGKGDSIPPELDSTTGKMRVPDINKLGPVFQLPVEDTTKKEINRTKPDNPRVTASRKRAIELLKSRTNSRPRTIINDTMKTRKPQSDGWFSDVEFWTDPLDQDGDGYEQKANIEWEADTYEGDSTLVIVEVVGWTDQSDEYVLLESAPYYIVGCQSEWWMGGVFSVPFQGEWSFMLFLWDVEEETYLDLYPWDSDPQLEDVMMESALEDVIYRICDASIGEYVDIDGDGFFSFDTLLWEVYVGGYKDTTFGLTSWVFARDESGIETFIGEIDTFYMENGTYTWQCVIINSPGRHGLYDFEIYLINPFGEISDWIPYDGDNEMKFPRFSGHGERIVLWFYPEVSRWPERRNVGVLTGRSKSKRFG
ncbi:MAG: hypothetical protein ABIK28_20760 [Planctomycetota bacterium]